MCSKRNSILSLLVILHLVLESTSKLEFTNVKCTSLDENFTKFEYCYLKSINRTYKYLSLRANLLNTPVTKIKLNFSLFKRFSGYRPFLYNMTVDSCRFLANTKSYPIPAFFYGLFSNFSNMNHTCPYDHDLIIDKLSIASVNHQLTKVLPFPEGDYLVETTWLAYDIIRASIKFYATLS
ncbi:uncharacterized protein [Drosophila pseudoobscura]|uniref:Uncharacterized protein n=1 Tax=Drosophila pseudoobscura pseudoobscura TaxID=46245 RepID=A0A6I8WEE1_DROPS|nr:uncharacterized protein LOC6896676 [Drosophila pseudoobscura]XP_033241758.1 uncharacterized protein LOC6896676 [Drosophila pseudoobscura]XP_033241759.1 uncharacterized protein LOC6896676 [Drosophila pseudoobscura]